MSRKLQKTLTAAMLCLYILLLMPVKTFAAGTHVIQGNGRWSGRVTNIDWTFSPDINFDLDFSSGEKILLVIPKPSLVMEVSIKLGVAGNFSLDLQQANLPEDTTIDSRIESAIDGLYQEKISDSFFQYFPASVGLGFDMDAWLVAGASQPVAVEGSFNNTGEMKISLNGITSRHTPSFEFTSIKPRTQNETVFFVGTKLDERLGIGQVGWGEYKIGPLMTGDIGFMGGGKAAASLAKDEWTAESVQNDSPDAIHSCTESGKDGCVSGTVCQVKDAYANLDVKLEIPVVDYVVYGSHFPLAGSSRSYNRRNFIQSLTWKEKVKYQDHCSHILYRIPVAVWTNSNKTIPARGVYLHKDGHTEVDSNVSQFAYRKTNRNGMANLYLPYIDGRYTIVTDPYNSDDPYKRASGSAQQPSDMRRGLNEQVDIILGSSEMETYSVTKT